MTSADDELASVRDAVEVQRTALLLLAAIAGAGALVAICGAVARQTGRDDDNLAALEALGMSSRTRVAAIVLSLLPAIALGAVMGSVIADLASALFPIGIAERLEPDPGLRLDAVVLLTGLVATLVAAAAASVLIAGLVDRRRHNPRPMRNNRVLDAAVRSLGPSTAVGVRFALQPGRGGPQHPPARRSPVSRSASGARSARSCSRRASTDSSIRHRAKG